jgi:DNA (cytosine-5)-methyltransferase 1
MAGYRELFACEWDAKPAATFQENFPQVPVYIGDVATLSVKQIQRETGLKRGELDILDGSPPCQGFSTVGKRQLNDERNMLFREYIRLLVGLAPKAFLMENVAGLIGGKMRVLFAEILQSLREAGYHVAAWKLNAMYFGVPQSRVRVIIAGLHRESAAQPPAAPLPRTRPVSMQAAITILPQTLGYITASNERHCLAGMRPLRLIHEPAPTLVRSGNSRMMAPWRVERLSSPEYTRFGSFPDAFRWRSNVCESISNSVPPLFMRAIAEHLRTCLDVQRYEHHLPQ